MKHRRQELTKTRMNATAARQWEFDRWRKHIGLILPVYRISSFILGIVLILIFPMEFAIRPYFILLSGCLYSTAMAFHRLRFHGGGITDFVVLGLDIVMGASLVLLTGGIHSPFLLFTLTPVVMAALFLDIKVTAGVALFSVAFMITNQVFNPFLHQFSRIEIGYLLIYVTSTGLIAIFPYMINTNVRQQLRTTDILQERRRLSHEIHDGIAQTVSALCWQVQFIHRRLVSMGITMDELTEMEQLAERAQREIRESLELLRCYTVDGDFLFHLKDYLKHLEAQGGISCHLEAEADMPRLDLVAEVQLLRICQEALANVRKHSLANRVRVGITRENGFMKVSIADDGRGFDPESLGQKTAGSRGQGLAVMRERAESVGGGLQVLSLPGRGTELRVQVPINGHRSGS